MIGFPITCFYVQLLFEHKKNISVNYGNLKKKEPSPNVSIAVVDRNIRSFTFSFDDFLAIWFKFVLHLDGNLTSH